MARILVSGRIAVNSISRSMVCQVLLSPAFVALNFEGVAATWLQTVELRGRMPSWEALHQVVCIRFDRDQYQIHMKHLDTLKQTGFVADYHSKFEQLDWALDLFTRTGRGRRSHPHP